MLHHYASNMRHTPRCKDYVDVDRAEGQHNCGSQTPRGALKLELRKQFCGSASSVSSLKKQQAHVLADLEIELRIKANSVSLVKDQKQPSGAVIHHSVTEPLSCLLARVCNVPRQN